RVYADWLMEHRDFSRFKALMTGARIQRESRNALDLAEAATLISKTSLFRNSIMERISAEIDREDFEPMNVYLVPGRRWPVGHIGTEPVGDEDWECWYVTVGARWVIQCVEVMQCQVTTELKRFINKAEQNK